MLLCGLHPRLLKEQRQKEEWGLLASSLPGKQSQTSTHPRFRERPCLKRVQRVRILRALVAFFWSLLKHLYFFSVPLAGAITAQWLKAPMEIQNKSF